MSEKLRDMFGDELEDGDFVLYSNQPCIVTDTHRGMVKNQHNNENHVYSTNYLIKLPFGVNPKWDVVHGDIVKRINDIKLVKKTRMAKRIKKREFKRFGVYCRDNDRHQACVYLGPCTIGGTYFANAWAQVVWKRGIKYSERKFVLNELDIFRDTLVTHGNIRYYYIKDIKYPLMHKHLFDVPEEDVLAEGDLIVLDAMPEDLTKSRREAWTD